MGMTLSRVNGNLTIHKIKVPMDYGWSGSLAENRSLARGVGFSIVNPGPFCSFTISHRASSSIIWPSVICRLISLSLSLFLSLALNLFPSLPPFAPIEMVKKGRERKTRRKQLYVDWSQLPLLWMIGLGEPHKFILKKPFHFLGLPHHTQALAKLADRQSREQRKEGI